MKKILVVNVNWLGDVVLSTPVFKALKQCHPQSEITCLGVPRVREILECCPDVDQIIVYDEKGKHKYFLGKLGIVNEMKAKKFDKVFLLHRSSTRAFLMHTAGIPERIGFAGKKGQNFLTQKVSLSSNDLHRADEYLYLLEGLGYKIKDRNSELLIDEKIDDEIESILLARGINPDDVMVVINPGGNWDLKRWPFERYALLIDKIVKDCGVKVVISGAGGDRALVSAIMGRMKSKCTNLSGHLNLKQLIGMLKRANVLVSGDSGPIHLASSVGTTVVGLFGPTSPERTGPRGNGKKVYLRKDVGCNKNPCYFLECPKNVCMQSITVDEVLSAVKKICENEKI